MKKRGKVFRFVTITTLVLALVVLLTSLPDFRVRTQRRMYALQVRHVQNMAQTDSVIIERHLRGYANTLLSVSRLLGEGELCSEIHLSELLEIEEELGARKLALVGQDGIMTTADGMRTAVSGEDALEKGYETDEPFVLQAVTDASNQRSLLISVPIFDSGGGQSVKGFLFCWLDPSDIELPQHMFLEEEEQTIQIVDGEGGYILKADGLLKPSESTNLFTSLSMMNTSRTLDDIRTAMRDGEEIIVEASDEDNECVICLSPIALNGWYTLIMLNRQSFTSQLDGLLDGGTLLLAARLLISAAVITAVLVVSTRRKLRAFLKEEIRLRNELLADTDGFMTVDVHEDTILRCTTDLIGKYDIKEMSYSQVLKRVLKDRVAEEYRDKALKSMGIENMRAQYESGVRDIRFEYPIMEGGVERWRGCSIHMEADVEKKHHMAYIVYKNVDAKKRDELLMMERADKDFLTGLLNRRSAIEQIKGFLADTHPDGVHTHAFLIIDLDQFKVLNDVLGHMVGDQALQDVAAVLKHHFREYDVISRLGGDEFMVFAKDMPMSIITTNLAALLKKLCLYYGADKSIKVTASIGVALAPMHGTDFETLYRKADRALYNVKEAEKNNFCIYEETEDGETSPHDERNP